jgi:hypothetical protein
MVSPYIGVAMVAGAVAGCSGTCGESHEVDGGTDGRCPREGFIDMTFHVPRGADVELCDDLVSLSVWGPPGIQVARTPEAECMVEYAEAAAGSPSLGVRLLAGGTWFESGSPIEGGLITTISSHDLLYCPEGGPSACLYSARCAARVTQAGSMTGDFVGAELTESCALERVDRGLPEGLVVTRLRLWGPLVTFSTGDSGVMCP